MFASFAPPMTPKTTLSNTDQNKHVGNGRLMVYSNLKNDSFRKSGTVKMYDALLCIHFLNGSYILLSTLDVYVNVSLHKHALLHIYVYMCIYIYHTPCYIYITNSSHI